jgi:hypothetical protein
MFLTCICGHRMSDVASPNTIEHRLLSNRAWEKLQDLVDEECAKAGSIDSWPEHWEASGATDVWRCPECGRLYLNARDEPAKILVYKLEQTGL